MHRRVLLVALFACFSLAFAEEPSAVPAAAKPGLEQVTKAKFHAHLGFLADDLLEGRGTGTRGHEVASRYVAAQFEALGLKPGGDNGTYYQRVPLREITVLRGKCELTLKMNGSAEPLAWGDGFVMGGKETNPDASAEAPVVFVGYGVAAPSARYDDYAGADVRGKVVAMLWGGPAALTPELRAHVSSNTEKLKAATAHGAIGVLTLAGPELEKVLPWPRMVIGYEFPSMRWLDAQGVPNDSFPQIRAEALLSPSASPRLFAGAPKSWAEVLRDAAASRPNSFPLPLTVRMHEVSTHRQISSPNVAAVLPGSDPRLTNEYVVYTAHSDHLGIGKPIDGDAIYNGALDNASGTAALLAIANAFASLPHPPRRSVMFVAVTAEEAGLLGSDYFAQNPTVPIGAMAANINMDGASLLYAFKDVVAFGAGDSSLGKVVQQAAGELGLKVSPDPAPEQLFFIRSDQYSFVKQGVPSIFLTEGAEARDPKVNGKEIFDRWLETRYHAPSDDMSQPMDLEGTVQFMQVNFLTGYEIAQEPQRPAWNPGDFFGETFGRKAAQ